MIQSTGWTWDYIDQSMTVPRVVALFKHFDKSPPLHAMVAAYLGVNTSSGGGKSQDLGELIAMAGPGGKIRGG